MFKDFDSSDLMLSFIGFGLMVFVIIMGITLSRSYDLDEQKCVKFYKENHYITNACEKYSNKLKEIK